MSWKTTVFGLLAAIGGAIMGAYQLKPELLAGFPHWLPGAGFLMSCIGTACVGLFARDNNKTSEQVGATAVRSPNAATAASAIGLVVAISALIGCLFALVGCAALQKGADPLVVRAEQTLDISTNTFSTLVHIDDSNRDFYRSNAPAFHRLAESLRQRVILPTEPAPVPWGEALIIHAWQTKQAYKGARTDGNSNALYLAWITLNSAVTNAQQQIVIVGTTNFSFFPH